MPSSSSSILFTTGLLSRQAVQVLLNTSTTIGSPGSMTSANVMSVLLVRSMKNRMTMIMMMINSTLFAFNQARNPFTFVLSQKNHLSSLR